VVAGAAVIGILVEHRTFAAAVCLLWGAHCPGVAITITCGVTVAIASGVAITITITITGIAVTIARIGIAITIARIAIAIAIAIARIASACFARAVIWDLGEAGRSGEDHTWNND
jgi:hypothetical protein